MGCSPNDNLPIDGVGMSNETPSGPGLYLVRYHWRNKMNGRHFDEWVMCHWDGSSWGIFSGATVTEWKEVERPV